MFCNFNQAHCNIRKKKQKREDAILVKPHHHAMCHLPQLGVTLYVQPVTVQGQAVACHLTGSCCLCSLPQNEAHFLDPEPSS